MLTIENCHLFQGVLPWQYLSLSHWEIAELMYANLQQILAQYEVCDIIQLQSILSLRIKTHA